MMGKELGNLPPQATELESAVLGAIMIDKNAILEVIDIISIDSFYKNEHKLIYKSILMLFDDTDPIDILTVTQKLRKVGTLEEVGGAFYISSLASKVNSGDNIIAHSRIIAEKFIKREAISISYKIQKDGYNNQIDAFELLDTIEKSVYDLSNTVIKKEAKIMPEIISRAMNELKIKSENPELVGVKSGIELLDKITGGWQRQDLIILAARPGMGKTAFAISNILNAALVQNKPVALFTLEMSDVQIANRMISSLSEVNGEAIRKASLSKDEWSRIKSSEQKLQNENIIIDDTPALTIREFRSKCFRLKQKHKIEMVVVDYLQLMVSPDHKKNREQEISYISRSLKAVAKELDIPVVALAQLSRKVEDRGGEKKPMLSDLRDSGAIEQDADIVVFMYRPEYYGFATFIDDTGNELTSEGLAQAIIAKNRNGALKEVPMRFIKNYAKFTDYEYVSENSQFPGAIPPEFPEPSFDNDKPF